MIKSRILSIVACLIGGILITMSLYFLSAIERNSPNGFIRDYPSHKIKGVGFLDLKSNHWSFSGADTTHIYLINNYAPAFVMRLRRDLTDTLLMKVTWPKNVQVRKGSSIYVDPPNLYLNDGISGSIILGKLEDTKVDKMISTPYYSGVIPLSNHSFAFRSTKNNGESVLVKYTPSDRRLKYAPEILQKQVDGVFCTDGMFIRSPDAAKLIYIYYYRNQFICMDTNLNMLYQGKTLDTVSTANISVKKQMKDQKLTLASPPAFVNKHSCATGQHLFIHSSLKADNEMDESFAANSSIDIYALHDGKYIYSLSLPDFKDKKMTDFKVYGQYLYALYDHYIYMYKLSFDDK